MKLLLYVFGVLVLLCAGVALFGPRETVGPYKFDAAAIGDDLDAHLADGEAQFDDIKPGQQKQIIWNGAPGARTAVSVVYLHGFSASLQEIRPVPDLVAEKLGANLFYTRLRGHGRTGQAMAEATASDWMADMAEAMEIGRRLGDRVIVIGTSTGATLATMAVNDAEISKDLAGIVMISPNFGVNAAGSSLLTWPLARTFVPWIAGSTRSWEPHNAAQGQFWTTEYPVDAVFPMAALVKAANAVSVDTTEIPAFFIYAAEDEVIVADKAARVADRWSGPKEVWLATPDPDGDPSKHVLTGDILSPGTTAEFADRIAAWAERL